jgi:mRNA-degrading endonuclease toxin of MazEF toxin-antitoxin module
MKIRKPGEVWLEGLGMVAKTRPVLIVSRADHDPRVLYLHVPLTSITVVVIMRFHQGNFRFCKNLPSSKFKAWVR